MILRHGRLVRKVHDLIEGELIERSIEYMNVTSRVKTRDSISDKIDRKKYSDYGYQLTDITGVRVISYLESGLGKIEEAVRDLFLIDNKNSFDRAQVLGSDRIGYRSVHYVCSLGPQRGGLQEYRDLSELKFEVQIRTVLQHAWAELAHDRSFKFGASLPTAIERKLNLYAGMLEIIDQGFDSISNEIDSYAEVISNSDDIDLLELEINSTTLKQYLSNLNEASGFELEEVDFKHDLIAEMSNFGIKTIADLDKLIDHGFIDSYNRYFDQDNYIGFVRQVMLFNDIGKYAKSGFNWEAIDSNSVKALIERHGSKVVRDIFLKNRINIFENDENITENFEW